MLSLSLPPLSLYVHIPWCLRKCPYCDFNSHSRRGPLPEGAYIEALLDDLEADLLWVQGRQVQSLFIGGGTPSLFSAEGIDRLLRGIADRLVLAPAPEITLEANPGTVERKRFEGFRAAGVNRLSLGVQSFDDALLSRLGRIHDGAEAQRALEAAIDAGFSRINIDLMYGLPGQSVAQAVADVRHALRLHRGHISHYQLTIEPDTAFFYRPPALPADESIWAMQQACQAALAAAGLSQYEVSAYAAPGQDCRHNLNYWRFGDYLGIGAGAHGKITVPPQGRILRTQKQAHPQRYLAAHGPGRLASSHDVPAAERAFEYLLNALRLEEGASLTQMRARAGIAFERIASAVDRAQTLGLAQMRGDYLLPTARGRQYLNDLLLIFLPDQERTRAPELIRA